MPIVVYILMLMVLVASYMLCKEKHKNHRLVNKNKKFVNSIEMMLKDEERSRQKIDVLYRLINQFLLRNTFSSMKCLAANEYEESMLDLIKEAIKIDPVEAKNKINKGKA